MHNTLNDIQSTTLTKCIYIYFKFKVLYNPVFKPFISKAAIFKQVCMEPQSSYIHFNLVNINY